MGERGPTSACFSPLPTHIISTLFLLIFFFGFLATLSLGVMTFSKCGDTVHTYSVWTQPRHAGGGRCVRSGGTSTGPQSRRSFLFLFDFPHFLFFYLVGARTVADMPDSLLPVPSLAVVNQLYLRSITVFVHTACYISLLFSTPVVSLSFRYFCSQL